MLTRCKNCASYFSLFDNEVLAHGGLSRNSAIINKSINTIFHGSSSKYTNFRTNNGRFNLFRNCVDNLRSLAALFRKYHLFLCAGHLSVTVYFEEKQTNRTVTAIWLSAIW